MLKDQLTLEEGQLLIKIARDNIATYLNGGEYVCTNELPEIFHEKLGVFVTLSINSNLRGCIGYPEPYMELIDGLLDVSIAAAVEDPRFNPISLEEFEKVKIEVSVLTKPQLVQVDSYEDYLNLLKVGRDGLIIENMYHRGLLLPQVPIEQNWDIETFLENLCYKAGLYGDAWKDINTKIYSFQAQIFDE
ncbi:MAG: TIGR00296 family protein [Methanosphaera sp.]|nr:TIGR00296 family protein [Methanobrevibacter sp.]MEE3324366.1 TIGR00296 family protein [Methanosphaera sp.]